jgi:hypothetical protein
MFTVHLQRSRYLAIAIAWLAIAASHSQAQTVAQSFRHMVKPSRQIAEHCVKLAAGQTIGYAFEATEPLGFNIHYHRGDAVETPVWNDRIQQADDRFTAPSTAEYCLTWTSNAKYEVIIRGELKP